MAQIMQSKSVYFKDVNLIASQQEFITSRKEILPEFNRIIVSPMAAVVGETFLNAALTLNLQVCLHRFCAPQDQLDLYYRLRNKYNSSNIWYCVGLTDLNRLEGLCDGANVLVDVANGYLSSVVNLSHNLQPKYNVMVGNVHSGAGFNKFPIDAHIRVGIGNGAACTTSQITGYNRGQITELMECVTQRQFNSQRIVSDGGIQSSGDACKAFAAGADFVMLGNYFAVADEAENIRNGEYKYWGGASHKQQMLHTGKITNHAEGKELTLDKSNIKPLKEIVQNLWGGIASGISYGGKKSLTDYIGSGIFELRI